MTCVYALRTPPAARCLTCGRIHNRHAPFSSSSPIRGPFCALARRLYKARLVAAANTAVSWRHHIIHCSFRCLSRMLQTQRCRSNSLFAENLFGGPKMLRTEPIPCLRCGNFGSPTGSVPMSLHKVSSINRSAGTNPASRGGESSLELEAIAAVHELSFAVQSISVSEMLPRTPDLIFVNVTTIEGQPYCLELTLKGWRITSLRSDCMVGDFTQLELFTKYYDSLYALMDTISPGYRARFGEKLALRLRLLQAGEDDQLAPCGSLQSPPLSRASAATSSSSPYSSNDSLPIVTPASTPAVDPGFDKPLF